MLKKTSLSRIGIGESLKDTKNNVYKIHDKIQLKNDRWMVVLQPPDGILVTFRFTDTEMKKKQFTRIKDAAK